MPMRQHGLAKLTEESGELLQIVGKLDQYPELCFSEALHPDGTHLRTRLVEEMGDLLAAIMFVAYKLELNQDAIGRRQLEKIQLFRQWDEEP